MSTSLGWTLLPKASRSSFGLSAVRNVGLGAIECILKSRDEDGPFKSLPETVRIASDLHAVNRRALEALILSGALDSFNKNRKQLMQDLPLVVDWTQSRAKDPEVGQGKPVRHDDGR